MSGDDSNKSNHKNALEEPLLSSTWTKTSNGNGHGHHKNPSMDRIDSTATAATLLTDSPDGEGGGLEESGFLTEEERQSPATTPSDADNEDWKNITLPRVLTCCCVGRQQPQRVVKLNHNVFLNLVVCVLYGFSDSLWSGTVLVAYLKRIGHGSNSFVGNVEAANGLAGLVSALPVGYLADTVGRSTVIAAGGMLLIVTACLHVILLEWIGTDETNIPDAHATVWLLGAIMALWGVGGGIVNGPAQALFADSTPAGERSQYYVYLFNCYLLSSCLGPAVAILLFETVGDDWDLKHLRWILYIGLTMEIANAVVMLFFDDKKALKEQPDENSHATNHSEHEHENATVVDNPTTTTTSASTTSQDEEQPVRVEESTTTTTLHNENDNTAQWYQKYQKCIPVITFVHSLIFSMGSGMTVKFFPLFFKDTVGMSPSGVQGIYLAVPIAMAACSSVGQKLASTTLFSFPSSNRSDSNCSAAATHGKKPFGRVQAALLLKLAGVSSLFLLVWCLKTLDAHPVVLIALYIARTSLINASYPLEESILMDFVPAKERARWKSLDAVGMFGWCGSAALGGYLADRHDYSYTFYITALFQITGTLVWCLLLPLVPRTEGKQPTTTTTTAQEHETNPNDNDVTSAGALQEPLLASSSSSCSST